MSSEKNPTRTRILTAAWELLDSNPGVAAKMSDIAKRAGVSRQALYLHFPNRTELFIATTKHQDAVFKVDEMLVESRAATSGKARLEAFITAWGNYVPKIFGIAKTLIIMKETDEDAARAWEERMADMREGCAAAVAALQRDGDLADGMSERHATDYLWAILSVTHWELLTVACGWDQAHYVDAIQQTARRMLVRT